VRIGRATTTFRGERFLIHRAELVADPTPGTLPGVLEGDVVGTARGALRLLEVQPPGRRSQGFGQFANGARITNGELLGGPISNSDGQR
jgi:methionyl-tRNA formyltransferase